LIFFTSILYDAGSKAQSPYEPVDMTPEADARRQLFEAWVASLPPYIPEDGGGGGLEPERWNWADVNYDGIHEYVGFPRNQGGCGDCWLFASIGVIEIQYMINCCYFGNCLCSPDVPSSDCVCPSAPMDLSEQLVMECSRQGYHYDCDASDYTAVEMFLTNIGTTYEALEPFELADLAYDPPFAKICPIQDRGDPSSMYMDRNGISDLLDRAGAVGMPLYYFRAVGSSGGSGFRGEISTATDFSPLVTAIAGGHAAYGSHGSHAIVIVGLRGDGRGRHDLQDSQELHRHRLVAVRRGKPCEKISSSS
jgi:hypothetical protein